MFYNELRLIYKKYGINVVPTTFLSDFCFKNLDFIANN